MTIIRAIKAQAAICQWNLLVARREFLVEKSSLCWQTSEDISRVNLKNETSLQVFHILPYIHT